MNRKALGDILNLGIRNCLSALFLWEETYIYCTERFLQEYTYSTKSKGRGIMFKIGQSLFWQQNKVFFILWALVAKTTLMCTTNIYGTINRVYICQTAMEIFITVKQIRF